MNIKKLNEKLEKIVEADWKKLKANDDTDKPDIWRDHIYKLDDDFVVPSSYNSFFSVISSNTYSGLHFHDLVDTGKTLTDLINFIQD